jgi:5-hydroxyisourate hydrolase
MGQLTTHVLDTAQGIPAAGVPVMVHRVSGSERVTVAQAVTNAQGRIDTPLLTGEAFTAGTYELAFEVEAYFRHQPVVLASPPYLDIVTLRFTVADAREHYHVPLLVSPWSYSTYRGS